MTSRAVDAAARPTNPCPFCGAPEHRPPLCRFHELGGCDNPATEAVGGGQRPRYCEHPEHDRTRFYVQARSRARAEKRAAATAAVGDAGEFAGLRPSSTAAAGLADSVQRLQRMLAEVGTELQGATALLTSATSAEKVEAELLEVRHEADRQIAVAMAEKLGAERAQRIAEEHAQEAEQAAERAEGLLADTAEALEAAEGEAGTLRSALQEIQESRAELQRALAVAAEEKNRMVAAVTAQAGAERARAEEEKRTAVEAVTRRFREELDRVTGERERLRRELDAAHARLAGIRETADDQVRQALEKASRARVAEERTRGELSAAQAVNRALRDQLGGGEVETGTGAPAPRAGGRARSGRRLPGQRRRPTSGG